MNGNLARSILCSLVTRVDFGWYSSIVGVCCLRGDWSWCVIAARGQTMSAARLAMRMMETKIMVRREFIVPLAYLNFRIIFVSIILIASLAALIVWPRAAMTHQDQ